MRPRARTRRLCRATAILLVLIACADTTPCFAQTVADVRAALVVRALGYERSLRAGEGPIRLVVAFDAPGRRDGQAMEAAFRAYRGRLAGRAILVRGVTLDDVDTVTALNPHVVYVANGTDTDLAQALSSALPAGTVSVCGHGRLQTAGCALGVEVVSNRSRPVVWLGAARNSGLNFEARLLRVSRVIP